MRGRNRAGRSARRGSEFPLLPGLLKMDLPSHYTSSGDNQMVTPSHHPLWNECLTFPYLHPSLMSSGEILSFDGFHFGPFVFFSEAFLFRLCFSLTSSSA